MTGYESLDKFKYWMPRSPGLLRIRQLYKIAGQYSFNYPPSFLFRYLKRLVRSLVYLPLHNLGFFLYSFIMSVMFSLTLLHPQPWSVASRTHCKLRSSRVRMKLAPSVSQSVCTVVSRIAGRHSFLLSSTSLSLRLPVFGCIILYSESDRLY